MECKKCKKEIPEESAYCNWCGACQVRKQRKKRRGNGQGSVYQLPDGKWRAVKTLGYEKIGEKLKPIQNTKSGFKTKKEALDYLPNLATKPKSINQDARFKDIYDLWKPTHETSVGKDTMYCYKSAYRHFKPIWYFKFSEIGIDDLQECVTDCEKGKRTQQNMKVLLSLLYKYAIPRGYVPNNLNYSQFIKVGGDAMGTRTEISEEGVEIVRKSIGIVPYADYIDCMIYTGYRPNEFLSLDAADYDRKERCFVGGGKTEAGTNRSVTVSPKIQGIVDRLIEGKESGPIFCDQDGSRFSLHRFRSDYFYPAIEAMGLQQPEPKKITPYSCRHTFATKMKRIQAAKKDKLELMGHASETMLMHYQHVNYNDLRKITDNL